jgi:hypothetical protein
MEQKKPRFVSRLFGIFEGSPSLFSAVADFDWCVDWQNYLSKQAELDGLKQLKVKTTNAPPSRADYLVYAREYHKELVENLVEFVRRGLVLGGHGNNEFIKGRFKEIPCVPPWEFFQSAVDRIVEPSGALTVKDRRKTLDHVQKRLAVLAEDIAALNPKTSRFRQMGAKKGDLRAEVVQVWIRVQQQIDAPCGFTGRALKFSKPAEQAAHRTLGIDQFVNPDAPYRPGD